MQKVKQIFSSKDDDVSHNSSNSPRNSLGSNTAGYDTTSGDHSGRTTSGSHAGLAGATEQGLTGSGNHHNVHTGSTGVGSNIGSKSDNIGTGVGNAATLSGTGREHREYEGGNQGLSRGDVGTNRDSLTSGTTGTGVSGREGLTGDRHGATSGLTGDRHASNTGATTGSHSGGLMNKITGNHSLGHDSRDTSKFDPTGENTHHDHKHLQHVTHETHRHSEVEEVERQREHHRHVHHLQHHVQPVKDQVVKDEVIHQQAHPVTNIQERHVNTDEDVKLFHGLGEKHRDTEQHMPKERTVVDLGEKVNTTTHHHVHHVTQPVVEREVHDRHRIKTVIPLVHTVHEAPIIHKSSQHEPVHMSDFLKGGGKLDSGITHGQSNLLATGDCDRQVDGVGEKLIKDLNLNPSNFGSHGSNTSSSATGQNLTGERGLSGDRTSGTGLTSGQHTSGTGLTSGQHSSGLTGERATGEHALGSDRHAATGNRTTGSVGGI